jgi:hypothetical protein
MVVKVEDGSLVPAQELLSGAAQDPDGKALKFTEVKDAPMPTYTAKSKMDDGSGRTRVYTFSIENTNVRVSMGLVEEEGQSKEGGAKTEKVTKEVSPSSSSSSSSTTEAKKTAVQQAIIKSTYN